MNKPPPTPASGPSATLDFALSRLTVLLNGLLDPVGGCPWDLEQTAQSISEDFLEETFELREALLKNDPALIREEAGDLTFLVFFLGRLLERGPYGFGLKEIIDQAVDKMVFRHPHVFFKEGSLSTSQEVLKQWHLLKKAQKPKGEKLLDSVPQSLPALARAHRLGVKAGRAGFDWSSPQEVRQKLAEELTELDTELGAKDLKDPETQSRLFDELGDVLGAVASLARHLGFSAEKALQAHNERFTRRFNYIETQLKKDNRNLEETDLADLEKLWQESKNLPNL
jgi:MazG family protein